jgi:hypothetical protein
MWSDGQYPTMQCELCGLNPSCSKHEVTVPDGHARLNRTKMGITNMDLCEPKGSTYSYLQSFYIGAKHGVLVL